MRYFNGNPVTLYVLTDQEDGDSVAYTNLNEARHIKKQMESFGYAVTLGKYDLRVEA